MQYFMPTKVVFGNNAVVENCTLFKDFGKKALIVTGKFSAKLSGALDDVITALKNNGQSYAIFDKVGNNPTVDNVYEGADFAKSENVDFLIAIGGGSPMDAGKAIALLAVNEIEKELIFKGIAYAEKILPMVFIPTTAGTGSEVTQYSILTNDKEETKTSVASPLLFPKVAILDGKYTEGLSQKITVNTAIDALSHAIEGRLSVRATQISDALANEAIESISKCLNCLESGKISLNNRNNLLRASTLAGMVIANTGTTAVHSMGYSLTYFKHIDHGRANGLLLGEFLKFVQLKNPDIIKDILSKMSMSSTDEFIAEMYKLLGEKETVTESEAVYYSKKAITAKNIVNSIIVPEEKDLYLIFKKVFICK